MSDDKPTKYLFRVSMLLESERLPPDIGPELQEHFEKITGVEVVYAQVTNASDEDIAMLKSLYADASKKDTKD